MGETVVAEVSSPQSLLTESISADIAVGDVVLFMKGVPDEPRCGFSAMAVRILQLCEVAFHAVDVLEDGEKKEALKIFSDWPTVPQLYVAGEFVGGSDIMREMFEAGELQQLLQEKVAKQATTGSSEGATKG